MQEREGMPRLVPIEQLNRLPLAEFGPALRPLFEASAPLAAALCRRRPFASYDELLARAAEVVRGLSDAERVEVVNGHPRLGESRDNLRRVSVLSDREQGADDAADARLMELNRAYEARFGFRCVVFVNRRPKAELVPVIEARLGNPRAQELDTAIGEMLAIAADRLQRLVPSTEC
jgi:2-oxo-4-hydroxy-4-carboxy--5-ureidoimidazoline (OHCU) decarboxylase